jgi:hypothetical protein
MGGRCGEVTYKQRHDATVITTASIIRGPGRAIHQTKTATCGLQVATEQHQQMWRRGFSRREDSPGIRPFRNVKLDNFTTLLCRVVSIYTGRSPSLYKHNLNEY